MLRLARSILATGSILAVALCPPAALAVDVPAAAPVMAQLLFVQNAHGVEIGAGGRSLTLEGMSPTTLFFSGPRGRPPHPGPTSVRRGIPLREVTRPVEAAGAGGS